MAHSVELLLDPSTDAAVREIWDELSARGLRSQGDHRGATNRPHVTLVAAPRLTAAADPGLARVASERLPQPFRLGAPLVFGGPRTTVALSVVVTDALLSLHGSIVELTTLTAQPELFTHCAIDAWTPHVTLARRVPPDQLAHVLSVAAGRNVDGYAVAARRWDSDAQSVVEFTADG